MYWKCIGSGHYTEVKAILVMVEIERQTYINPVFYCLLSALLYIYTTSSFCFETLLIVFVVITYTLKFTLNKMITEVKTLVTVLVSEVDRKDM